MKLVVFGATGGIGARVVEQGLAAGHDVTAVARRPEAISVKHRRLTVVQGDVLSPQKLPAIIAGQDAVVSAVGARDRGPTTVYSAGASNVMQAMTAAGVRRIIAISASGLEPGPVWQRVVAKQVLWRVFKYMYADLVLMEQALSASDLDWTILRPPQLTDGPCTGHYQIAINRHLSHGSKLSRADTADYILKHLSDPATYHGVVEVAY